MTPIDPNGQAFPRAGSHCASGHEGLTIRAELAARAMQGLLTYHNAFNSTEPRALIRKDVAKEAMSMADALIAALNEAPTP